MIKEDNKKCEVLTTFSLSLTVYCLISVVHVVVKTVILSVTKVFFFGTVLTGHVHTLFGLWSPSISFSYNYGNFNLFVFCVVLLTMPAVSSTFRCICGRFGFSFWSLSTSTLRRQLDYWWRRHASDRQHTASHRCSFWQQITTICSKTLTYGRWSPGTFTLTQRYALLNNFPLIF